MRQYKVLGQISAEPYRVLIEVLAKNKQQALEEAQTVWLWNRAWNRNKKNEFLPLTAALKNVSAINSGCPFEHGHICGV